jgi:hypothetical protein
MPHFRVEKFAKVLAKHTGIDYSQLGAAIGLAIVEGLKYRDEDPEKVRIQKVRREQMRETQREAMKSTVDKWLACSHMRTHPHSGTAHRLGAAIGRTDAGNLHGLWLPVHAGR